MSDRTEKLIGAPQGRFALVAARFNDAIVDRLVAGATEGLKRHGVKDDAVDLVRVPGSFEIPLVAQRLALSRKYAAVICLGAVIRGDTDHYDFVAKAAADGILRASLDSGVPVIFGVLTCDTVEQALRRAVTPASTEGQNAWEGNKGFDAALAAIEMVNLLSKLPGSTS